MLVPRICDTLYVLTAKSAAPPAISFHPVTIQVVVTVSVKGEIGATIMIIVAPY